MPALLLLLLCAVIPTISQAKKRTPSSDAAVASPAAVTPVESAPAPAPAPVTAPPASQSTAAPVAPAPVAVPVQAPATAPTPAPAVTTAPAPAAATPRASSPFPPEAPEAAVDENPLPRIRPSVYLSYNTGSQYKFNSTKATALGQSLSGDATYNFETAPGIGVDVSQMRERGWGWQGGLGYAFGRTLKSARVSFNGQSSSANYSKSSTKLTILDLSANAVYRWSSFYIPFGFNYSIPNLSGSSYSIRGAFGLQFGVGFEVVDRVSIEVLDKLVGMKVTYNSAGVDADLGTGYMNGIQINVKYGF